MKLIKKYTVGGKRMEDKKQENLEKDIAELDDDQLEAVTGGIRPAIKEVYMEN